MATKKRKEDDEVGLDKKRRKSGVAANGAELHGASATAEEQQPIVSLAVGYPSLRTITHAERCFPFADLGYD